MASDQGCQIRRILHRAWMLLGIGQLSFAQHLLEVINVELSAGPVTGESNHEFGAVGAHIVKRLPLPEPFTLRPAFHHAPVSQKPSLDAAIVNNGVTRA